MKINIKKLDGSVYNLEVTPETTIPELKQLIQDASSVPIPLQRVIYKGKYLRDEKDLQFYKIEDGVTLHLAERPPESTNPPPPSTSTTSTTSTSSSSSSSSTNRIPRNDLLNSVMRSIVPSQVPFDTQLRDAIANVNNPSNTLVTGPVPPDRDGHPYDPQQQPSHERLSDYFDLTLTEINRLVERMNHLNEQLRNNNNITDPAQRVQLQAEATAVGLSLSRLSNATGLLSQCTNAFRTTDQPNGTHFVPSISQITLNLGPNGITPVSSSTITTPADLLSLQTSGALHPVPGIPGTFISLDSEPLRSRPGTTANSQRNPSSTTTSPTTTTTTAPSTTTTSTSPSDTTSTTTSTNANTNPNVFTNVFVNTNTNTNSNPNPNPNAGPSVNVDVNGAPVLGEDINNVISQTLNGLFSSLGQQPNNNPLGGILNSVLSNIPGGSNENHLSDIFSNISQMFQSQNNNNNNNYISRGTSPLLILFINMPHLLNGFQLISNGGDAAVRQGHRLIRQILVQELLSGNSSTDNIDRMVESYTENIRYQVAETTLPEDLSRHVINQNYPDIVARLARKYLKRFLLIFINRNTDGTLQNEISSFSSDFVKELIESLSECFDNGSQGAFDLIDTFVYQKIISESPALIEFSTMTSQYLRDVYQSNNSSSPSTTTTQTQTQTQPTSNNFSTTTTTTGRQSSNSGSIIPPEWMETIEIDQARQSSGTTRTPSSTYLKGKTPKVKKENDSNNNNNTTTTTTTTTTATTSAPFRQILERSVDGTQIDSEELLKTEEAKNLSQMYQNIFFKNE
ncbi:hypothetical protein DICPUDRAFT_53205 [Dictyostelium purpureum]|uniref:Ubiquitin-like domain-containing protein n=1 Tax=Dictyostelium purpureum TaxID=5786 RepID=F0ZBN4_DICPU|nr:uncharacterized protein DICPUDRAFT_53205 [Dictyostelium purpureum]EGC38624.1 hypothetical protein DICPUDRAFT_53205 [Dictyostelium purpureum]|eukprot:XP_003284817.1 hypothetical protein DICPUDRAFT_53205 [Dictyostelium purpureum]